jgi:hypothetical protein
MLAFRECLLKHTAQAGAARQFKALVDQLSQVRAGRRFSREEMNER